MPASQHSEPERELTSQQTSESNQQADKPASQPEASQQEITKLAKPATMPPQSAKIIHQNCQAATCQLTVLRTHALLANRAQINPKSFENEPNVNINRLQVYPK